jgi:hypothetical protein
MLLSARRRGRACPGHPRRIAPKDEADINTNGNKAYKAKLSGHSSLLGLPCAEPRYGRVKPGRNAFFADSSPLPIPRRHARG